MSLPKRSSPRPPTTTRDLRHQVITCLNKLSDRDTLTIATTELQSIARNLTHDSFSPFLTCIYGTDSSQKTPVRKQCVNLLGFLSETHGDALSPFLSKMLANIIRRLKDQDSAVRLACIDAVSVMALQITRPPFSVFLKPLTEAIILEQDYNSQIGSALCLASAIEASPDPEPAQLQRLLPRLMKLLKSESFKAKPALLSLIGSIAGAGGASSHNVLGNLIPCLVEFLSSQDWAARKAAAEALQRLAVVEKDLLSEFKDSCLKSFETRRFDKVKVVRDTMIQMLAAWKDVPGTTDEVSQPLQSRSSVGDNASDGRFPPRSRSPGTMDFGTPEMGTKTSPTSRLRPQDNSSTIATRKRSPLKSSDGKSGPAMFRKLDHKKDSDWKTDIAVPHGPVSTVGHEEHLVERDEKVPGSGEDESNRYSRPGIRRVLFNKNCDDKTHKYGGLKSGSRVVPFHEDISESAVVISNVTEEINGNRKDNEDLSLIRKQLVQIENQQSSLLDLLQRFIGSSQNGMQSLETRVHGLEMALDDISYDLAVSTGRMSNTDSACCKLPGADFLSSKFWRKVDGRYSTSKIPTSGSTPPLVAMHNVADRDGSAKPFKLQNRRYRFQGGGGGGGGFVVNPLAQVDSDSRGNSEVYSNGMPKNIIQDSVGSRTRNGNGLDVASPVTGILPADTISCRSSV